MKSFFFLKINFNNEFLLKMMCKDKNTIENTKSKPKQGRTQVGARAFLESNFIYYIYIYIVIIYFIYVIGHLQKPLALFLLNKPNQPHPTSNYSIQKLNKNNKNIHNNDCILAPPPPPQKKKKTILLPKNQKIMCYWRS